MQINKVIKIVVDYVMMINYNLGICILSISEFRPYSCHERRLADLAMAAGVPGALVGVVITLATTPIDVGDVTDDGADDDDDTFAVATTATDVKSVADAVTTGNNVGVCWAAVRPLYSNICFIIKWAGM